MSKDKDKNEDIMIAFIVLFLLGIATFIIWYLFEMQLKSTLRWIRYGEIWLTSLFLPEDYAIMVPGTGVQYLKVWKDWLPYADMKAYNFSEILASSHIALAPLKYIFVSCLGIFALWVMIHGPGTEFRRKMDLQGLIKEQAKSFPSIAPFVNFNPIKATHRITGDPVPLKLPLFAEALSPEEWIAHNGIEVQDKKVNVQQTWDALGKQLGKRWQGPLKLAPYAQGLYAAFALRHARKRKESELLLDELSLLWTPGKKYKLSGKLKRQIKKIIKDPKLGGRLEEFANQHAFEHTALLRCLSSARAEGGVLAPASFLWLRGINRHLWYPLNSLGRQSFFAEGGGALIHYTNELIAGQKIPAPQFEGAILGIEAFLKSGAATSIPPRAEK